MTKEDNPQKGYYNEAEDPEQLLQQPPDVGSTTAPVSPTHNPSILPTNNGTSHQPFSSYEDVLNYMNEHMESKDEEKKRKKREKTQQIITGIADMGRALANLYYTSQHAPNSYNGEVLSEKVQQRIDKAKAEREKERDWHLNYAMNMAKLKQGDYRTNLEEEKAKLAQDKWESEEQRKNALNQARVESYNAMTKYREAIAGKNDALAKKYEEEVLYLQAKQRYLELGYNLKQAETQARIDANEALAAKRRQETGNKTTTRTTTDANGRTTTTETSTSYEGTGGKGTGYGSGGDNQGKGRGY